MVSDAHIQPWLDRVKQEVPGLSLFDAHTHIGHNDPDGFSCGGAELVEALERAGARAVVFPMHEPAGYGRANDMVIAEAEAAEGRLVPFCRLDPRADPVGEAERCLSAGARGFKLHPRAERFTLDEPAVDEIFALAAERAVCVLVHAGRGIPALGRHTVALSGDFPDAKLILAHCAISDLAWLWRELPAHRNVFVDTSWWHPSDLLGLFALVAPGQILWASDSPNGLPFYSATLAMRCALQAGLAADQLMGVMGGQMERIIEGRDAADLGPPPGPAAAVGPLLERVVAHLTGAVQRGFAHTEVDEPLALARLACAIGEDDPDARVASEVLELLDGYERLLEPPPPGRMFPEALRLLVTALVLARTPEVPLPDRLQAPPPVREAAE